MGSRGTSGSACLILAFTALAGLGACSGDDDPTEGSAATSGSAGASAGAGMAGASGRGGSSGGAGSGGGAVRGGASGSGASGSAGRPGTAGTGGTTAGSGGRPVTSSGGSGAVNGNAGTSGRPASGTGDSPYEIECHGETVMCGDPTALLCLGLRVETEVFGYACSNECESDADCSTEPASGSAAPGCVDFVNKKYCLLVCRSGDDQASCPTGMYCYTYPGATSGSCLWQ